MTQYRKPGQRNGVRVLGLAVVCWGLLQSACAPSTLEGGTPTGGPPGAPSPPPPPPPLGSTLLQQPAYVPGSYAVTPQPFPNPSWVIGRPYPGYPVYGLFTYTGSYQKFRQDLRDVGWRFFRIAGPYTDADMLMLMQDDVEASFHVAGSSPITAFATEEEFLSAAEQQTVTALDRYGPGGSFFLLYPQYSSKHIKYVHVWNEPNYHYLIPGTTITPQIQEQKAILYGKLLLRVSGVIRARWPTVTILGFDTGRADPNSTDFIRSVYSFYPTLDASYDVLATHPGVDPVPPEADNVNSWGSYSIARNAAEIRNILGAQGSGASKPLWFTEAGWKIPYSNGGLYQSSPETTVPPMLQAAYACRYYAMALRLGADMVTPFFIVDVNGLNGGFFDDVTLQWRPCAYAVQNMIALMPAPKLMEVLKDGEDGVFAYRLQPDATLPTQASVIMVWNVDGPKTITLNLNATQVQVIDMLGATELGSGTGTYQVEVGPYPIYIKGT